MKNATTGGKTPDANEAAKEARDLTLGHEDRALTIPNVWSQPPVDVEPQKLVSQWSVHRATPKNGQASVRFDLHFVGRDLRDWSGCVSSKIVSFDPKTMRGTTRSGRVYQLVGMPGHCSDGDYVLGNWAHCNDVDVEDVTEEFMKTNGLTREGIQRIEGVERLALRVFGTGKQARRWLDTFNAALGAPPASMLDTPEGRDEVRKVLAAIETGGAV